MSLALTPQQIAAAPKIWVRGSNGIRHKRINPTWLAEQEEREAERAVERQEENNAAMLRDAAIRAVADRRWNNFARLYRLAVAERRVPSAPIYRPLASEIVKQVAFKHGMTVDELKTTSRLRSRVQARHEAMYRIWQERGVSLTQIAKMVGVTDHSTVHHGIRKHQARIDAGEVSA